MGFRLRGFLDFMCYRGKRIYGFCMFQVISGLCLRSKGICGFED